MGRAALAGRLQEPAVAEKPPPRSGTHLRSYMSHLKLHQVKVTTIICRVDSILANVNFSGICLLGGTVGKAACLTETSTLQRTAGAFSGMRKKRKCPRDPRVTIGFGSTLGFPGGGSSSPRRKTQDSGGGNQSRTNVVANCSGPHRKPDKGNRKKRGQANIKGCLYPGPRHSLSRLTTREKADPQSPARNTKATGILPCGASPATPRRADP